MLEEADAMATRMNKLRKLLLYLCFACFCVTVILFQLTNRSIGKYGYMYVPPILQFHITANQLNDSSKIKSSVNPNLRQLSHAPPMYNILIVSLADWRKNMNILPRTVTCEDSQSSVSIEKADISDLKNTKDADFLLFTSIMPNDKGVWLQLHRNRRKRQLWVFSTMESAFGVRGALPRMSYIQFNITATYHPSANIQVPYGKFVQWDLYGVKKFMTGFVSNLYHQKQKLAVWVSSHCATPMWRRSDFVHDLAKLVPVDMYGDCGRLSCPKVDNCTDIFGRYKFIIAFENSCCGGYITEKFWNALGMFHAIPIVVGARKGDYLQQAPPNSFIHVDDFDSMQDLAEYILEVAESKELYDHYIKWKVDGYITQNSVRDIYTDSDAGVCRLLNYTKSHPGEILTFDPYGPNWLGGCFQCGEHAWIRKYSNWQNEMSKSLMFV